MGRDTLPIRLGGLEERRKLSQRLENSLWCILSQKAIKAPFKKKLKK